MTTAEIAAAKRAWAKLRADIRLRVRLNTPSGMIRLDWWKP